MIVVTDIFRESGQGWQGCAKITQNTVKQGLSFINNPVIAKT